MQWAGREERVCCGGACRRSLWCTLPPSQRSFGKAAALGAVQHLLPILALNMLVRMVSDAKLLGVI